MREWDSGSGAKLAVGTGVEAEVEVNGSLVVVVVAAFPSGIAVTARIKENALKKEM
ncbi:hypothetical protein FRB96_009457 [Tulasnella sp. 330]|nr:hypothetical protein FRB96_009457 [Tulasnella sp. 330]KAG8876694.1 hypothetical protein FRB97_003989 [Tulasnella sp. 331]KAG8887354.1 hypothetical protein FRB98_009712 [Tulasnella sp. 332]